MLVGCGVKDDLKLEVRAELLNSILVADVSDQQLVAVQQGFAVELHLQPVKVRFVVVQHMERSRSESLDLAAQFASNRASGTRHQNALALDHGARCCAHDVQLLSAEQPIDSEPSQVADSGIAFQRGSERR